MYEVGTSASFDFDSAQSNLSKDLDTMTVEEFEDAYGVGRVRWRNKCTNFPPDPSHRRDGGTFASSGFAAPIRTWLGACADYPIWNIALRAALATCGAADRPVVLACRRGAPSRGSLPTSTARYCRITHGFRGGQA